ncbi:Galactosyltransferase family protein [Perilla frutescens var. frutescens]|nr:Galactosyltransferase family protein [Perilla frutescens var. frutescens]
MWAVPEANDRSPSTGVSSKKPNLVSDGCDPNVKDEKGEPKDAFVKVSKTPHATKTLDKTISDLEMELAAARTLQDSLLSNSPLSQDLKIHELAQKRKYFMVVGINTAFSSRKRRDSLRTTWMLQGDKRRKLEEEKGIVIRFVIGHSATSGGILDRAIEAEDKKHGDFLRLNNICRNMLRATLNYQPRQRPALTLWDAEFYVKVDDDVHVNIATLGATLARHRSKLRVYIGCMKSGPVLAQMGVRYYEPEYWKFGEQGNKHVLHKYTNEDVSIGSWFIGLDVEQIDDRRLCCGTPPDCEWKAQTGNICVASFDWSCSGICNSADRIKEVH